MASLTGCARACAIGLALYFSCAMPFAAYPSGTQSAELYAQSVAALLDREFPSPQIDYLLMDLRSGQVIAMRWSDAEAPMPPGSLLKPFVALAYARLHASQTQAGDLFPAVVCHGQRDGCWHAPGHGSLRLEHALAESCNVYFLALARDLAASPGGHDALQATAAEYGLPAPPAPLDSAAKTAWMWIGLTPEWRIPPRALAMAYAKLASQPGSSLTGRLLTGMKLAAQPGGTAWRLRDRRGDAFAKTGTAPCVPRSGRPEDRCRVNGDGLVVVVTGPEGKNMSPHMLWLVRRRGTTGAMAAELAGRMIQQLQEADGSSSHGSLN